MTGTEIDDLKEYLTDQIRVQETMIRIYSEGEKKENRIFFYETRRDVFKCCLNKIKELETK